MLIHLILVEPAGVEPASCNDIMTTYYMLVPFLRFFVLRGCQWTGALPTILSKISQPDRKTESVCQGTADAPGP